MPSTWPFVLRLALSLVAGYLLGSLNGAIILVRILTGRDVREMGTGNPGTANVGRTVGRGWGAIVFFFDGVKALAPLLLARGLLFPSGEAPDSFALAATGIAAILGHIKPVWFGFLGGGGVATTIFVYLLFIPVEIVFALLVSATLAIALVPRTRFRFGRWTPMFAAVLAPVFTALSSRYLDVPLVAGIRIGGHPWHAVVSVLAVTLFTVGMNVPILIREVRGVAAREG